MPDLPLEDYKKLVAQFTREAADDFRQSGATEQEQRAALCRYFRRGAEADLSHPELIDFLAVSTPSVLDMAGYSQAAADRVMLMLREITDDEIPQMFIFGIHWSHGGNTYYDELLACEEDKLINYFNQRKRSDVTLVKVELCGPEDMTVYQLLQHPCLMISEWWRQDYGLTSKNDGT